MSIMKQRVAGTWVEIGGYETAIGENVTINSGGFTSSLKDNITNVQVFANKFDELFPSISILTETLKTYTATNTNPVTLELSLGRNFKIDASSLVSGNSYSIAVSSPVPSGLVSLTLLIQTGTVSLPTISSWMTGVTAPTLVLNKTHWFTLATENAGTTWRLFQAGQF